MNSRIWGGRFIDSPSEIMEKVNNSIDFDKRLASQDILGSIAHCNMLELQGIIAKEDSQAIISGLRQIEQEIINNEFIFKQSLEDIHMNIEGRLEEIIGKKAGRLHTARSRNDQVATDFKIWIRDAIDRINKKIVNLQSTLIDKSEQNIETIMPGFTHLQTAQPVTFGHHLLAYVEMLGRDGGRFKDCRKRLNECPLGSGALAGTSFNIDREKTAKDLNFDKPTYNSLDSVSDRDFAIEFLSASSILSVHLSRLAEELVIWNSSQFNFINVSDSFSTGSSMMPQKRNPDAAELIRGKTGSIIGSLTNLLVVMKGLPMSYSKDMQQDKEPAFQTSDTIELCLEVLTNMIKDLSINSDKMYEAAKNNFSTATDLADWLVKEKNIPFRESHHIVGKVVKLAEELGCELTQIKYTDLKKIDDRLSEESVNILSVESSVKSRKSYGGTSPNNVKKQIKEARKRFIEKE